MPKLRLLLLGMLTATGVVACGDNTQLSPYEQAALDVEAGAQALSDDDDDAAFDAMDSMDEDEIRGFQGDGFARGGHHGDGDRGRAHHRAGRRHGQRGDRHGRGGHGALLWYADLDALQACRDLRDACRSDAGTDGCRQEVRACVRDVMQDAMDAMCADASAMCEDDADAPSRQCRRITRACGGDSGAGFGDGGVGRDGHDGKRGRDGRGDRGDRGDWDKDEDAGTGG